MPDETVTIRYEADTTRYAAGARRVSQDLDKIAAKAARAEAAATRATRAERRGLTAAGNQIAPGLGGLVGGTAGVAQSAAFAGVYGVKKLLDDAKEADPAMAKLGESISKMVGPASQTTDALNRVNVALDAIVGIAKNIFSTTLAKNITIATAAIGAFAASIGNLLQFFGASKLGGGIASLGEDAMAAAYNDATGGSGRGGVVEMEKKLEEAKKRRKERDEAARSAARGASGGRSNEGFQGSAGLYVTSGAAMMANQTLAIQRSMLRELQSLTRATDRVRDTIRDTAYTS